MKQRPLQLILLFLSLFLILPISNVFSSLITARTAEAAGWYNSSWQYRILITIPASQVTSDLTNFPVHINLADLNPSFFDNVSDDGKDIRVTMGDGTTEVPREVVSVNSANEVGTDGGEIYFKAPSLSSSTDTEFYVYYDNPGTTEPAADSTYGSENVWMNGFAAVYHMEQANVVDSTSNHNNGTAYGGPTQVAGIVGGGIQFDGVNDHIRIPSDPSWQPASSEDFTVSVFVNDSTSAAKRRIVDSRGTGSNYAGFQLQLENVDSFSALARDSGGAETWYHNEQNLYSSGEWHQFVMSYESGGLTKAYIDAVDKTSSNPLTSNLGSLDNGGLPLALGATVIDNGSLLDENSTENQYEGPMDEVRISSVARSGGWISAEYKNISSTGFYSAGIPTDESGGQADGIVITESDDSTDVTEGGNTDTYTIVLTQAPSANVTIALTSSDIDNGVTISPTSLIFTPSSWSTPQMVTVTAVQDTDVENDHTATISHSASSSDLGYNNLSIPSVTVNITDDDSPDLTVWLFGDPHISLGSTGYLPLESAIKDTKEGGTQGGESFNWDIAVDAGDYISSQTCPTDAFGQALVDQYAGANADPNKFYGVIGNHDASANDASWFEKWVDPLGQHTEYSGVSNENRPYPVDMENDTTWDHYSFQVGNILYLMLGDHNYGGHPFGRDCSGSSGGGSPAGSYSLETFNWWKDKVEANPDKIIITVAHHGLYDTTIYTGLGEGVAEGIHGNQSWADERGSSMVYAVGGVTIDNYDANHEKVSEADWRGYGFKKYLDDHPGAIDMWVFGHTHTHLYPGKSFNGRSDIETVDDVHFINLGSLTIVHAGPEAPFSRILELEDGSDTATLKTYLHTTAWSGHPVEGFYDDVQRQLTLRHPFELNPETVDSAPVATDDTASLDEDTQITIGVLENDSDTDGDSLTVSSVTAPGNGSAVINEDGTITYTPNSNFNGTDSFDYTLSALNLTDIGTVTITINSVNDDPVADFTFSGDPTVTFTNTSSDVDGAVASSSWDFGDGNTSIAKDPIYTFSTIGTHTVKLIVTDNEGATEEATKSISINSTGNGAQSGGSSHSGGGSSSHSNDSTENDDKNPDSDCTNSETPSCGSEVAGDLGQVIQKIIEDNRNLFIEALRRGIHLPQIAILSLLGVDSVQTESIGDTGMGRESAITQTPLIIRDLEIGMNGSDVLALQKLLNNNGFVLTEVGDGSRGHETTYFGELTQSALAAYQAANNITPSSGYFGPITRTQMESAGISGRWW